MTYTLGTASTATGKSKATLSRAIKKGIISAVKKDDGSYDIDPSELHRVYPLKPANSNPSVSTQHLSTPDKTPLLEQEIQLLKDRVEELKQDRDDWKKQAQTLLLSEEKIAKKGFLWWGKK